MPDIAKTRYSVMIVGTATVCFGVYNDLDLANKLRDRLASQRMASVFVVPIYPEKTAAGINRRVKSWPRPATREDCAFPGDQEHDHDACEDVVAQERGSQAAGGYLRSVEITSDGPLNVPTAAELNSPNGTPLGAPPVLNEPERTTYTRVEVGDLVAVDIRPNGYLFPAIKRLPKNTVWLKVAAVDRTKKFGHTSITIRVEVAGEPRPVALRWDAPHTAITRKKVTQ